MCARSRSQQNFKMSMNVQMIFFESLNLLLPYLVWWCIIMSQIVFQKDWFAVFKVKVTVKNNMFKICLFNIWTADPFASKLGLMAHHHRVDCLVKRLDCSAVVKVTEKAQNFSDCSSEWYLLWCWTFCNQTWYGDAASWAKICKKIGLLSSSSGSLWGLIWSNMTVSTISAELLIFLQANSDGTLT